MSNELYKGGIKKTEVFHRLNPYDLITISATFDDREINPPPRTYFPAVNPEQQLNLSQLI